MIGIGVGKIFLFISVLTIVPVLSSVLNGTNDDMESKIPIRNATIAHERQNLIEYLFKNYDKRNYPKTNTVSLQLSPLSFSIDEDKSIFVTNSFLTMEWQDPRLIWDPKDFGNESDLKFPSDQLWLPDIQLMNRVDAGQDTRCVWSTKIVIRHTGVLTRIVNCHFETWCKFTLDEFPYGNQTCTLKFSSWTFDGDELDVRIQGDDNEADLGSVSSDGEWKMVNSNARRNAIYYGCCPEPYVDVTFDLIFHRKPKSKLNQGQAEPQC